MKEILNLLERLNFTKTEAAVYLELIKNSALTGYQVAKNLNMARSSIYSALDNLYKRGVVFLLPGDAQVYKAENPSTLLNKMKQEFVDNADLLEEKLNNIDNTQYEERYLNIEGYDNVIAKTKELLMTAEKEVYINTDFNLNIFEKEFQELFERGVRIIVFSFSNISFQDMPIEIYKHEHAIICKKESRMMLVVDYKKTLIAERGQNDEFLGTFTENRLLASIVSEHIHHDIYLLKLRKKYNVDLIDNVIKINTLMEKEIE